MVRLWKYAVPLYLLCIDYARAAFGVTQDSRHFIVDTGSSNSLVFQVNRNNGDIASLNFRGTEFQNASPYSHIGSGLGSASVSSSVSGGELGGERGRVRGADGSRLYQNHRLGRHPHTLLHRQTRREHNLHGNTHHPAARYWRIEIHCPSQVIGCSQRSGRGEYRGLVIDGRGFRCICCEWPDKVKILLQRAIH